MVMVVVTTVGAAVSLTSLKDTCVLHSALVFNKAFEAHSKVLVISDIEDKSDP